MVSKVIYWFILSVLGAITIGLIVMFVWSLLSGVAEFIWIV